AIPDFMGPVTDLGVVEKQIANWNRAKEIENWNNTIGQLLQRPGAESEQLGETDLRIVIHQDEFAVEWLRPGRAAFESIKSTPFKQLLDTEDDANVRFTAEAQLMREILAQQQDYYSHRPRYDYENDETAKILARILRLRMLDSRVVAP